MRKIFATLVLSLLAVFAVSAVSEAAPKTNVRQRPRHSSRVATGATKKKPAAKTKKRTHKAPPKQKPAQKPQ